MENVMVSRRPGGFGQEANVRAQLQRRKFSEPAQQGGPDAVWKLPFRGLCRGPSLPLSERV